MKAAPHVLHLIETGGPGGAERVVTSLALALGATGEYRSAVGLLKDGWVAQELRRNGQAPVLFQLRRPLDPALLWALVRHLRAARVDLVHAHEFTMNVYGGVAAALAQVPAVGTVHGRGYYAEAGRRIAALKLASMGIEIDELTEEQEKYLNSWQEGTV